MALAKLTRRPLRAGEYGFQRASLWTVLRDIQSGRVYLHRVLVPEGDSIEQVGATLARERLGDPARFRAAAADARLLRGLGVPVASAEGYLFPDTYLLPKTMREDQIVAFMVRRFFDRVPRALVARAAERGRKLHALVPFASIVEKEARVAEERPVIAGVFARRLAKGMPLQADPTVLYGLHRWDRKLSLADLKSDTPYNTYRRTGLPPGPICSPGLASLRAAADPAEVP
ncbi:MAG: endolytic transglycosylase MltG, partial [bacterium]